MTVLKVLLGTEASVVITALGIEVVVVGMPVVKLLILEPKMVERSALPVVMVGFGPPVGLVTIVDVVGVSLQKPSEALNAFITIFLIVSTFNNKLRIGGSKPDWTKASPNCSRVMAPELNNLVTKSAPKV